MTLNVKEPNTDELPIPKLCRETLVGIEGLKRWDEEEGDEYLEFFSHLIEDLKTKTDSRRGSFPLIERLNINDEEKITEQINELSEFATELKAMDVSERKEKFDEDDIKEKIEQAEEIYTHFRSLENGYNAI